jgi:NAD(P)-binding Rossmann-like domain
LSANGLRMSTFTNRITRRGVLKTLAGAASLGALSSLFSTLSGCVGNQYDRIESGPSHQLGHQLRDGYTFPEATVSDDTLYDVIIVGGGVSGLSAAWWLKKHGINSIKLLELEDTLGGNARSGKNAVSAYPWGAHYVPIPNPESKWVRLLFEELGVITGYSPKREPLYHDEYLCHDPQERLLKDGVWSDGLVPQRGLTTNDKDEIKRFFEHVKQLRTTRGEDGQLLFQIPIALSSSDSRNRALDNISMAAWLDKHHYHSKALRWYVNYCCRDDYGLTIERTSAWAGLHYFAGRRGTAANAEPNAVLTWPEGNGWLVQQLHNKLGALTQSGAMVYRVTPGETSGNTPKKRHWEVCYWETKNKTAHKLRASQVIWAAPKFLAPHVVPTLASQLPPAPSLDYAPWLVTNITLKSTRFLEAAGVPLAWDNVSVNSPSLGYVVATHQNVSRYPGKTVLTYYYPLSAHDPKTARQLAYKKSQRDWEAIIIADLTQQHPGLDADIEQLETWVWGHGMASPTPGSIWTRATALREQYQSFESQRLYFAHSDSSGLSNFEEAQYHGILCAEKILKKAATV